MSDAPSAETGTGLLVSVFLATISVKCVMGISEVLKLSVLSASKNKNIIRNLLSHTDVG